MRNTPEDPGSHQRLALKTMLSEESEEHMSGSTDLATVILNSSTPPTPAVVGGLPVCIPMTRKNGTKVIRPFDGAEVGIEPRAPDSDPCGAQGFSGHVLNPFLHNRPSAPP